ncbi:unnamed protein product, partial [Polarella glacialis]
PEALAVSSEALEAGQRDVEEDGLGAEDRYSLSFAELQQRVRGLAQELRRRLPGPSTEGAQLIAVCLQRTPALVVALLGILSSGAAYLPLEPTHPGARLRYLLEDSGASLLVTCWCARRRGLLPDERLVRVTAIDGRLIASGSQMLRRSLGDGPSRGSGGVGGRPWKASVLDVHFWQHWHSQGRPGRPKRCCECADSFRNDRARCRC